MRIQELIHLHALLLEVRGYLEREGVASSDAFTAYDAQTVRPSHVHRRKAAHLHALGLLLGPIDSALDAPPPPERQRASNSGPAY